MTRAYSIPSPPKNGDRTCSYPTCNKPVGYGKQKWCSSDCGEMSFNERNWIGIRQIRWAMDNYKCTKCRIGVYIRDSWNTLVPTRVPNSVELTYHIALFKKYNNKLPYVFQRWTHIGEKEPSKHLGKAEIDHIITIAEGGAPLDLDNLQTLCSKCHKEKTRKDLSRIFTKGPLVLEQEKTSLLITSLLDYFGGD